MVYSPTILDSKYDEVMEALESEEPLYKTVLLIGRHGAGKTTILRKLAADCGYQLINAGQLLSKGLLPFSKEVRPAQTGILLKEACSEENVVLIDNTEVFFHPELKLNVLRLLSDLGRKRKHAIVVSIAGTISQNGRLLYSEPPYEDSKNYDIQGLISVCIEE